MTLNGLEIKNILQKLIYSSFFFRLHNSLIFTFLIFRIVFGRTCYGTTVEAITTFLMIFGAHVSILFIVKGKVLVLIN